MDRIDRIILTVVLLSMTIGMVLMVGIVALHIVNLSMSEEYTVTEKCIDKQGFEFKDQYCKGQIYCGPMGFMNDLRCESVMVGVK